MATERFQVIVSERGTNVVRRNLQGVGDVAGKTQGAVTLLNRALGALVGGAAIAGITGLADSFTNVQNRIRTVTTGSAQLAAVTDSLFKVSNRTRVSFEDTAKTYARLRNATVGLGLSQQETIKFTEGLSQAAILSGASSEETARGLVQLSQGLAGGILRAEEFNSLMEQTPGILQVVADSLGVPLGNLRALLLQGKLTADVFITAFQQAEDSLANRFAQSVSTVSQGVTVFRNNLTRFIGEFDKANKVSETLGRAIGFIGENIETVSRGLAAFAILVGITYGTQAVGRAITATRAFTLALLSNPFVAVGVVLAALVASLVSFADKIKLSADGASTLSDTFVPVFNEIKSAVNSLAQFFRPAFDLISSVVEGVFGEITITFRSVIEGIARGLDFIVNSFLLLPRLILSAFSNLPEGLDAIFTTAFNRIISIANSSLTFITGAINSVLEFTGLGEIKIPEIQQIEGVGKTIGDAFGGSLTTSFEGFSNATERVFQESEKRAQARIARTKAEEAALASANAALGIRGARTNTGAGREVQARQQKIFRDSLTTLQREAELLSLSAREQERLNITFDVAGRLKRGLNSTESEALNLGIRSLQAARDRAQLRDFENDLTQESIILLQDDFIARQQLSAAIQLEDNLQRKLTATELESVNQLVARNEALTTQRRIVDEIRGPQQEFLERQDALNALLADGRISIGEYNVALRDSRIAALEAGTSLEAGFTRGLLKIQADVTDLASVIDGALTNAFRGAEDAFVSFVQTGKLDFGSLVDSITADLARLAFRQATGGIFSSILGGVGGLFGSGGGGGGFLSTAIGAVGGLFGGGAGAPIPAVDFANGGDFTIGGRGGRDNNILSVNGSPVANVSRGEMVTVSPQGGGQRPINVVFNITTPDAESFQRSQGQIGARVQQALSRASARNN